MIVLRMAAKIDGDDRIFVNPEHIIEFHRTAGKKTTVRVTNGENLTVVDTPDEIVRILFTEDQFNPEPE